MTNDDGTPSFKYKASLINGTDANRTKQWSKIAVPLRYWSNLCRLLEMPLINCKVEPSLRWIDKWVLTTAAISANPNVTGADSATFKVTDAKLYAPVVTLSEEGSAKLAKQLDEGFKRPVYWNKYKVIIS